MVIYGILTETSIGKLFIAGVIPGIIATVLLCLAVMWITWRDPSAGLMEAMATSRLFGFHDDIAIRVRPEADGTSRIDVRSKSRDGQGDLGVNAARIRTFVAALEAGAATPP